MSLCDWPWLLEKYIVLDQEGVEGCGLGLRKREKELRV